MDDSRKRTLEREKKILEKYQELGNPARTVLSKIMRDSKPKRWSVLKKIEPSMNDKVLKEGIDQLIDFKIITKKDGYYSLYEKHHWQLGLIARKQSDKINLDSYQPYEIINENTSKSKTTIYGLKSEVFRAVVEGKRNTDIGKKETLQFVQGIKAKEMFGECFGVPLGIKIRAQRKKANEKEIINEQREHYLDLVKKGMRIVRKNNLKQDRKTRKKGKIIKVDEEVIKDVIESVINAHRNTQISFKETGENFVQKLLELKKEYRFKEMERTYNFLLKNGKGKTKRILKEFKEEFISIMNHCDIDKVWLEETIFKFHGQGRGLFSTIGISEEATKEAKGEYEKKWERNIKFRKVVDKLEESDRKTILDFLIEVIEKNLDLYPTHVSVLCRVSSSDIMPLTEPKPPKSTKSSQKLSGSAT